MSKCIFILAEYCKYMMFLICYIAYKFFVGKEEELYELKELNSEALTRSRELTYTWLHTQCGDINTTATSKWYWPSYCTTEFILQNTELRTV